MRSARCSIFADPLIVALADVQELGISRQAAAVARIKFDAAAEIGGARVAVAVGVAPYGARKVGGSGFGIDGEGSFDQKLKARSYRFKIFVTSCSGLHVSVV